MKEVLLNVDKFIALNELEEITNPIMLDRAKTPTPDGILSTQIFGASTKERRMTFAYIDLKCHVMQPIAYKTFKRLDRRIDSILSGSTRYSINKSGEIVEDENGGTGADWLYANWSKIKFKENDSKIRNNRVKFFKVNDKEQIWQSKAIVCPAFFRDINLQDTSAGGKPSVHKINGPYVKLITLASLLDQGNFSFNLDNTKFKIQLTLVELYEEFKSRIEKKRGIIRQNILGKSIDYGLRVVISSPKFTANRPSEMQVDYFHAGVPLGHCIATFTPFFVGWIQRFFINEFEKAGNKIPYLNPKTGEVTMIEIENPLVQFNDDKVIEMMKLFKGSPQQRFDPITVKTTDPKLPEVLMMFKGRYVDDRHPENVFKDRPMTLTDLFYMAAVDITKDKHCYITRYPIHNYFSSFPVGITVLSTVNTCKMEIDGVKYDFYPIVEYGLEPKEVPTRFTEVTNLSNVYLKGINGDYDGDQITLKGVFSQEANLEAEKIMRSNSQFITMNTTNKRTSEIESIQTLYMMTRWNNPNEKTEWV